jgi:AAA+ superfamily predicted ATPase
MRAILEIPPLTGAACELAPAQRRVADEIRSALATGDVCVLRAAAAMGKTTILHRLHAELGGSCVRPSEFMTLLKDRSPMAIEETFLEVLEDAVRRDDLVLVDDFHLIANVVQAFEYPRAQLMNVALSIALSQAAAQGKKLLFAIETGNDVTPLDQRALFWTMDDFEPEDFACVCRHYLDEAGAGIDFTKVHRFAPTLNGYQLKNACLALRNQELEVSTDALIDFLRARNMVSNVDLQEVDHVEWNDLKGMDDVVEQLEAKIALPFENAELAMTFNLKPKRGVLLAGPPGTGKTTVGRALAHRLKGKFFLIDGTINAGDSGFHERVDKVFEDAKRNAPSVIFIDDADVIFEAGNHGLYRYLLTMMDGLESASNGQVCVIITAMDSAALPPALLRSGRIELWLTTRLPDENARRMILVDKLSSLPPPVCYADISLLASKSRGLSGADLKSVVEEGKLLYAHAVSKGCESLPVDRFFISAIETTRANRRNYGRCSVQPFRESRFGFPVELN